MFQNLVLTFDYDAWEQIVSFPYDLDSVHRVRISERERTDEGTEVDEIVRVSKLVRTCKTFYNRYRVRNQQNWLEWKLHKNNEKDCLAERVENAERPRALCTVTWNEDLVMLVLKNIKISVENRIVPALRNGTSTTDEVRNRKYVQKEVFLSYDVHVDEDFLMTRTAKPSEEQRHQAAHGTLGHPKAQGIPTPMECCAPSLKMEGSRRESNGCRIIKCEAKTPSGRIGYSADRGNVPTLPNGPAQWLTLFWVPHTMDVTVHVKISGGELHLTGRANLRTFGLASGYLIEPWVKALMRETRRIRPHERYGWVRWTNVEFVADNVRPVLPNERIFIPAPPTAQRSSKAGAQGRPDVFDIED